MRTVITTLAGLSLLLATSACETVERDKHGERRTDVERPKPAREVELLELTEKNPDDSRTWYLLGDYYERRRDYPQAFEAYKRMQEALEKLERKQGRRFTGGLFALGRICVRMRHYRAGEHYLKAVLELKPKSRKEVLDNKNFRESHILLAAIYAHGRQWNLAEEHARAFKQLGGDERADSILLQCEDQKASKTMHSSYPKGDTKR